jgi:hypothetical protein
LFLRKALLQNKTVAASPLPPHLPMPAERAREITGVCQCGGVVLRVLWGAAAAAGSDAAAAAREGLAASKKTIFTLLGSP